MTASKNKTQKYLQEYKICSGPKKVKFPMSGIQLDITMHEKEWENMSLNKEKINSYRPTISTSNRISRQEHNSHNSISSVQEGR